VFTTFVFRDTILVMENSLVSIIIPTFNGELYVRDAVDSALSQTYKNIEVIVVNDGSTDNTRSVLSSYIESGKIKYFFQENMGLAGARNAGIKSANGKYIAFLDSDDIFLPAKIEKQIAYLDEHKECDVSYCDIWHFFEETPEEKLSLNYVYCSGSEVFSRLLKKNFINPLTIIMRRSVYERFGGFNESFKRSEDWEYWIRLSWRGVNFCFLPEKLARYRMRASSLSYSWESEVQRKQKELDIFLWLFKQMSKQEKRKYNMRFVVLYHWAKLLYAKLGNKSSLLRKIHSWLQKKRLKSA